MTVLMLVIREPISASPSTVWYREAFTMHSSDVLFSSVNKTGILDANLVDSGGGNGFYECCGDLINVGYIGSDGCFVLKKWGVMVVVVIVVIVLVMVMVAVVVVIMRCWK